MGLRGTQGQGAPLDPPLHTVAIIIINELFIIIVLPLGVDLSVWDSIGCQCCSFLSALTTYVDMNLYQTIQQTIHNVSVTFTIIKSLC